MGVKHRWLLGFTAVFAVLAAVVFWGCWSADVTFVSPDDGIAFPLDYGDVLTRWWNNFLTTGRMLPSDVVWSGLFGSPHVCRELKYVSAVYCAALGLAYFLRGRGLSYLASFGAGLSLAFSGYWLTLFSAGHAGWFVWMTYGVFAFGLVDRALERGRWRHWLLLGLTAAWGSFYQPDLWLIFTVFTAAYFAFRLICLRTFPWPKMLAALAVFSLVGAPSFYSAFANDLSSRDKQIGESKGTALGGETEDPAQARWIFTTNWSMPPADTAEFLWPRVHGDTSCPLTLSVNKKDGIRPYEGALGRPYGAKQGNYRQHSLYVGFLTCLLALAGCLSAVGKGRVRRQTVLFFLGAGLVFYLFSLGRHCEVVYRFVYSLPFGDYLRAPVKWHHLTEFCLCVLAGFGIEFLLERFARLKWAPACVAAAVALGALNLAVEAHRYCAPVDYSRAIRTKKASQLTVVPKRLPQLGAMINQGVVVPVANWVADPENLLLVQYLQPAAPAKPATAKTLPLTLGLVSVLTALGALAVVFWRPRRSSALKERTS